MSDPSNLAKDAAGTTPAAVRRALPDFNFDTPDEEAIQYLEKQWLRFCRTIGLEGEIPDIRAIMAEEARKPRQPPWRQSHWLVRPFVAVYDWFRGP